MARVVTAHPELFQPTLPAFTGSDDLLAEMRGDVAFQPTLPAFTGSDVFDH